VAKYQFANFCAHAANIFASGFHFFGTQTAELITFRVLNWGHEFSEKLRNWVRSFFFERKTDCKKPCPLLFVFYSYLSHKKLVAKGQYIYHALPSFRLTIAAVAAQWQRVELFMWMCMRNQLSHKNHTLYWQMCLILFQQITIRLSHIPIDFVPHIVNIN
jgi:hypothetical protein